MASKISVLCLTVIFSLMGYLGTVHAVYTPSTDDLSMVTQVNQALDKVIAADRMILRRFSKQIKTLTLHFEDNERMEYILGQVGTHLEQTLATWKAPMKKAQLETAQKFLDAHTDKVLTRDEKLSPNCSKYNKLIDDLAFVYDHPTPLLIATRHRESTCGYYLPNNTRGPFQIMSRNYGTGDISEKLFIQTIEDYLQFARNKYDRYQNANKGSGLLIDLSYTYWTMTGIIYHSALYNGLSGSRIKGDIQPAWTGYLYENIQSDKDISESRVLRDGILATFLKYIDWELMLNRQ